MITEILVFILTSVIVFFVYTHKKNKDYFEKHGLRYIPGWPVFGNTWKSTFLKQHIVLDIDDVYKAFPNDRYVGYIEGTVPIVMVRDPALIKMITVKDFDNFTDHRDFFLDPLFSDSMLMMKGDKWRDMRTTMSPAFTGSKIKQMVPFIMDISQNLVAYLKETEGQEINVDDLIRRYTNDVIASAAFGLQVNSFKDPNNEFFKTGQTLMSFSSGQRAKMFLMLMVPFLSRYMSVFSPVTTNFFRDIVKRTMADREEKKIERPDMIQLLLEASKGTLKHTTHEKLDDVGFATAEEAVVKRKGEIRQWTQDELVAQAFIFFFAAFESSASVLVMAIHELAVNPEAHDKLYQEIRDYQEKHGKLAYEGIQELKYLDCVLNETFRKWSPALIMDRVCQKPYTLPPPREGGKPYTLPAGAVVYNLVNSLQMDEQYYPDPSKFDPERFSDENKHKIQPFTFMPFGSGPRNCVGSRLALLELKVLLYYILLNFEILKGEKTSDPIKLQASDFNIKAEKGTFVKFRSRV